MMQNAQWLRISHHSQAHLLAASGADAVRSFVRYSTCPASVP